MQLAVKAGVGISIALAGVALGVQLLGAHRTTPALPPVASDPICVQTEPPAEVTVEVRIPDPPRYFQVDLDGDGTPELAVDAGSAIVVERLDHHEIARIPLVEDRNPCTAEFSVENDRIVVQRYRPVPGGCEAVDGTDYYRMRDGRLGHVWVTATIITIRE